MLITYKLIDNKYFKNDSPEDEFEVQIDLPKAVFNKLLNEKICKIREETVIKTRKLNERKLQEDNKRKDKEKKKDTKLLESNKYLYRTSFELYKGNMKLSLLRKNIKGFYNFVTYLENDSEEYIDEIILKDIKEQIELNKSK